MGILNLESLLYEQESSGLDFKRDSYVFIGATDEKKSEILKDILAFVNAWRRTDAVILTGVDEVECGKHRVVGIDADLDDAALQQFVKTKTQRPVTFEYRSEMLEGLKVGVFIIPVQQRPVYLLKDYGRLKRNVVYIRRGTMTDEASPDEIKEMAISEEGAKPQSPILSLSFADVRNRESIGSELKFESVLLKVPNLKDVPDYVESHRIDRFASMWHVNADYYRELVRWYYLKNLAKNFGFVISNDSVHVAQDVRVEIVINKSAGDFKFLDSDGFPIYPRSSYNVVSRIKPLTQQLQEMHDGSDIDISEGRDSWLISITFEKIRPRQIVFTNSSIVVASKKSGPLVCAARIYADNLPSPIECELVINPTVTEQPTDLEALKKMHGQEVIRAIEKRRGK